MKFNKAMHKVLKLGQGNPKHTKNGLREILRKRFWRGVHEKLNMCWHVLGASEQNKTDTELFGWVKEATRMLIGLEHLSYEGRLSELGLF